MLRPRHVAATNGARLLTGAERRAPPTPHRPPPRSGAPFPSRRRRYDKAGTDAAWVGLMVERDDGSTSTLVAEGEDESDKPQFPTFYDNSMVLFHTAQKKLPGDLWRAFHGTGEDWSTATVTDFMGDAVGVRDDISWKDANVNHTPSYDGADPDQPMLVTFGGAVTDGEGDDHPVVSDVNGHTEFNTGDATEVGELGKVESGSKKVQECHHPAWNHAGDEFMCFANKLDSTRSDGTAAKLTYRFARSAGEWAQSTNSPVVVESISNADLATAIPELMDDTSACTTLNYKYAEWCYSDRYVVVTVYCEDAGGNVLGSRVCLVDTDVSPMVFYDLTSEIEAVVGGTLRGVFSTCGRVGGFDA